jgi:hypothetical protein
VVDKKQVVANKYDLSASRYRHIEQDQEFFERPTVRVEALRQADHLFQTLLQRAFSDR